LMQPASSDRRNASVTLTNWLLKYSDYSFCQHRRHVNFDHHVRARSATL